MMWRSAALVVVLALAMVCYAAPSGEGIQGGIVAVSINNPEVQEALKIAVDAFNTMVNSQYMFKAERVIKAQSQVVAGIMYFFEVEMAETGCRMGTVVTPLCDNSEPTSKPYICSFEVVSVPWLGQTTVNKASCEQCNTVRI